MENVNTIVQEDVALLCYHCGEPCEEDVLYQDDKKFCCTGCKTVFEILNENNLCEYYTYQEHPGVTAQRSITNTFAYLDEPSIQAKLLRFQSEGRNRVEFFVPSIHCISCLWLLENLKRLAPGVIKSEVQFSAKQVTIDFNPKQIQLSSIAAIMHSIGYPPTINLEEKTEIKATGSLVAKVAVAGFCFGNIMLLSFPEYLGIDGNDEKLKNLFSFLNLVLAVPVTFYSGIDYFKKAFASFKQKQINIDVPIAIGLAALFLRSSYDIIFQAGPGYLDSLSGLVFFLLIGRWFQDLTYESLAFDRDYKSYFPLAVQRKMDSSFTSVLVYDLQEGDTIRVRNLEIIPADSILISVEAFIDYSFVTGEAKPSKVRVGEVVYAGGRLLGEPVELCVKEKTSQSHLTSLWNNEIFQKPRESSYKRIIDTTAKRFTWIVLVLTVFTGLYWYSVNPQQMWLVVTSVLMVACPCALALAAPFTYGSMLRVFGQNGFYLKNADVIERMANVNAIVFDKTGTLTHSASEISFLGILESNEMLMVKTLASSSTHPLSSQIVKSIKGTQYNSIQELIERPGKGIEGVVNNKSIKLGSPEFVGAIKPEDQCATYVFVSIDNEVRGYFKISTQLRTGIQHVVKRLITQCAGLLSGDNESDKERMLYVFGKEVPLHFNQSPHDKLHFVRTLQEQHKTVMMLGDGLNDAGALKQSDVGIAVTDDTGMFTPACDGILKGSQIIQLDRFVTLAKSATRILKMSFGISFFYNVITLSFAVSGHLTPLVAAILMPISSISVVGFSSLAVRVSAHFILKK